MPDVLTTLDAILAPSRSALLVVDLQNDFIHPGGWSTRHHPEGPSLRHAIPPVNRRGMAGDVLCAEGTWGAELDADVSGPRPGDLTIVRHSYDGFAGTPLDGLLRARGVETVVGTGVVTNLCVQATVQHAFALGYYVVVAEDATAAVDPTVQAVTLDNFRRFLGAVVPAETIAGHWRR